ncbi:hypothetical protein F2Q69_00049911, partial [Brassica cretica]
NWYCYGNMVAEQSAWETQKAKVHILKYLTGSAKTYANLTQVYVDVRNVALGHVMPRCSDEKNARAKPYKFTIQELARERPSSSSSRFEPKQRHSRILEDDTITNHRF